MSVLRCEACSLLQLIGIAVLIVRRSPCNKSAGEAVEGAEPCAWFPGKDTRNPKAFSFFAKQGCSIGFILATFNHLLLVLD